MKSQCLLLPRIKTATTGYTNCLRLYNTTICAARKEETTQRASHIRTCTYTYMYLLMCMCVCAADASNSKSGGCLPDSPTDDDDDDPLHGCGVSDKNINQAVSLMSSCPSTGCVDWLYLARASTHKWTALSSLNTRCD